METTPVTLLTRAIDIGRELVNVCDAVGHPIAGTHISLGLDMLIEHLDAMRHAEGSGRSDGLGDQG